MHGQRSGNVRLLLKALAQQFRREAERIRLNIHKNGDTAQPEQSGKRGHIGIGRDRDFFSGQPGALKGQHEGDRAVVARQHMRHAEIFEQVAFKLLHALPVVGEPGALKNIVAEP